MHQHQSSMGHIYHVDGKETSVPSTSSSQRAPSLLHQMSSGGGSSQQPEDIPLQTVIDALHKSLPPFNLQSSNAVAIPVHTETTLPCIMISENIQPPRVTPEIPQSLVQMIKKAREFRNACKYTESMQIFHDALIVLNNPAIWTYTDSGLSVTEAIQKLEEDLLKQAEIQASLSLHRPKSSIASIHSDITEEPETFSDDGRSDEETEGEREGLERHLSVSYQSIIEEQSNKQLDPLTRTDYEIYFLLSTAALHLSSENPLNALIFAWKAKLAKDKHEESSKVAAVNPNQATTDEPPTWDLSRSYMHLNTNAEGNSINPDLLNILLLSAPDAIIYSIIGEACFQLQYYTLALQSFSVSLEVRRLLFTSDTDEFIEIATSCNNLAVALSSNPIRQYILAHIYMRAATEILEDRVASTHPRLITVRCNLNKLRIRSSEITDDKVKALSEDMQLWVDIKGSELKAFTEVKKVPKPKKLDKDQKKDSKSAPPPKDSNAKGKGTPASEINPLTTTYQFFTNKPLTEEKTARPADTDSIEKPIILPYRNIQVQLTEFQRLCIEDSKKIRLGKTSKGKKGKKAKK